MKKLTAKEISNLQSSDKYYHVKLGKLESRGLIVEWEGKSRVYIERHKDKNGIDRITCITTKDYEWAEGSYRDIFDDGIYVEDYAMFIYEID